MANELKYIISAVDKTTAVVGKVKGSFNSLMRPVTDLGKSLSTLGRETGVTRLTRGLGSAARAAGRFTREVARAVTPLAALTGLGSIAGLVAMVASFGRAGQQLQITSEMVGMGTGQLQQFRGAARLAGLSADSMDASLQSLGDTMQGAVNGRAPQALALMSAWHIGLKRTKSGAIDTASALMSVSRAIQSNLKAGGNVQSARQIAQAFGVEQLLPMLIKGPGYIQQLVSEYRDLNAEMSPAQISQGQEYAKNMAALDLAVDGLKNSLGNALIPILGPAIEKMTEWLAVPENKAKIIDAVTDAVTWLADGMKQFDWEKAKKGAGDFFEMISKAWDLMKKIAHAGSRIGNGLEMFGNGLRGRGFRTNDEIANIPGANTPGGEGWRTGASHATAATNALFSSLEQQNHLPSGLLDSVWSAETARGSVHMVSPKGALGHFQFMPKTAQQYGLKNPYDLQESAGAAARMYSDLLRQNHGNLPRALAAYNWGQGNLEKYGMTGAPQETRSYIGKVLSGMAAPNTPSLYATPHQPGVQNAPVGTIVDPGFEGGSSGGSAPAGGSVQVEIHLKGAPPGTTSSVRTKGDVAATAHVGQSMDLREAA